MIKIKIETDCTAIKDAVNKSTKAVKENAKPVGAIMFQLIGGGLFLLFGIIILWFGFTEEPVALLMGSVITLGSGCWVLIALRNTTNYDQHKKEMRFIPYNKMDASIREMLTRTMDQNKDWAQDIVLNKVAYCAEERTFYKNWF